MAWNRGLLGISTAVIAVGGLLSAIGNKEAIANFVNKTQGTLIAQNRTINIVFPSRSDSTDLQNKANAVAAFLSRETGMPVTAQVGDDTAAVEALRANRADVAFLSSRPALKAEQLANAKLYLAEVRDNYSGRFTYNSVFVVPASSPLKTKNEGKATLEQLRGRKMVFTSPTSGSGFIFPTSELVRLGLVPNLFGFPKQDYRLALQLLSELGLHKHAYQKTSSLSGGQQQRVAIARALIQSPEILLADEPITGLDVMAAKQVMDTLAKLNHEHGITIVTVLHDLGIAAEYAQRALVLDAGRIVYDGTCNNLKNEFAQINLAKL